MDKRSSKQQFCKSNAITFVVQKTGAIALAQLGLTAGRLAGSQNTATFSDFFKIICWMKHWNFSSVQKGTVSL